MLEAFVQKAEDAGGRVLAYGRARAEGPEAVAGKSGVLAVTERGLVFVVEDLFDAAEAVPIAQAGVDSLSRSEGPWGAELTIESGGERWQFSRIETEAADALAQALGLAATPNESTPRAASVRPGSPIAAPDRVGDALGNEGRWFDEPQAERPFGPAPTRAPSANTVRPAVFALAGVLAVGAGAFLFLTHNEAEPVVSVVAARDRTSERGQPSKRPVVAAAGKAQLAPGKAQYRTHESIEIRFQGFPGNAQDWVTVVPSNASERSYEQWFYLHGKRAGTLVFGGLPAGTYEARAYFDWPSGGYTVRARAAFDVAN